MIDDLSLESPLPAPSSPDDHTHLIIDDQIHRSIIDGLKVHHKSVVSKGRDKNASPGGGSDAELLVSMAQRLGAVERELLKTKREIVEKVGHVQVLSQYIIASHTHCG